MHLHSLLYLCCEQLAILELHACVVYFGRIPIVCLTIVLWCAAITGTKINKNVIGPRKYFRLRLGHMVQFGASSRMYLLQASDAEMVAEENRLADVENRAKDKVKETREQDEIVRLDGGGYTQKYHAMQCKSAPVVNKNTCDLTELTEFFLVHSQNTSDFNVTVILSSSLVVALNIGIRFHMRYLYLCGQLCKVRL